MPEWCDFLVPDPVSGETSDLSIISVPDDVAKGELFKDGQDLQQLVRAEDVVLSESLQRICTAQHTGKQEHTVSMRGRGSWADMERIYTAVFGQEDWPRASNIGGAGFIMRADKRKILPFV